MTDGGGWTRRVDGSVDFDLYWEDFKDGFGSPDNELWLGNEKLFTLTNQRRYQLRNDFVNRYGAPYYAKYDFFRIQNEASNYRLKVETYSDGDAGDSLTRYHNNEDFSTRDEDNDDYSYYHIAADSDYGAWWSMRSPVILVIRRCPSSVVVETSISETETKTETRGCRDRDRDQDRNSRTRPRPTRSETETKTETDCTVQLYEYFFT
ncbi:Ficolin-2 [Holothuria leucospilota]|uniref:Ficolin-2 n=1 Tax=Holothuria leucospilota TaxID=206669 RepID=A0A9Q1BWB8_HOLLE|nr:Ficolin-2 [Holothuria leucospilota]